MKQLRFLLKIFPAVRDQGQALVLLAGTMTILLALVGMSIDVGRMVVTRTDLQKSADAAALAGAQRLPQTGNARVTAEQYADLNRDDIIVSSIVFLSQYVPNDTIVVTVTEQVQFSFLRLVGLDGREVGATAQVRIGYFSGGRGLQPWGLVANPSNDCFTGESTPGVPDFKQNTSCVLKEGAPGDGGDFGALGLDGGGASIYRDTIVNGSKTAFKAGDKANPETGNMVGPTWQGTQDLFNQAPPASCPYNSADQILVKHADGTSTIRDGCEDHPRIIIIPVVDVIDHQMQSTILGFAFMFLEDVKRQGGLTQVHGQFINFVTALPGATYEGTDTSQPSAIIFEK